jgi:hypothetical protein
MAPKRGDAVNTTSTVEPTDARVERYVRGGKGGGEGELSIEALDGGGGEGDGKQNGAEEGGGGEHVGAWRGMCCAGTGGC